VAFLKKKKRKVFSGLVPNENKYSWWQVGPKNEKLAAMYLSIGCYFFGQIKK